MNNILVKRVSQITTQLVDISQEGYDLKELTRIWSMIPIGEDNMAYLESVSQCILEVSTLVDQKFGNLTQNQRSAKKYRLMARLLNIKADELDVD
jgi:hypothetical protein